MAGAWRSLPQLHRAPGTFGTALAGDVGAPRRSRHKRDGRSRLQMAPICVYRLRYHNECPAGDNEADADPAASRRHPACRFLLGPLVAGFQRRPPVGWSAHRGTIFKNAPFALSMRAARGEFSTHPRNRGAFACRAGQSRRRTAGENPSATSETYPRDGWKTTCCATLPSCCRKKIC